MSRDPDTDALDAAAWLMRSRPLPDDEFVDRLERRLVARGRTSRARVVIAGLGVSGAMAAALVGAMFVSGSPLRGGDDGAQADENCRVEKVRTVVNEGQIVRGADGKARVVTIAKPVTREVRRCR